MASSNFDQSVILGDEEAPDDVEERQESNDAARHHAGFITEYYQ
jgi:hypothetical protein